MWVCPGNSHSGVVRPAMVVDRNHSGPRVHACLAAPEGHHQAALADRGRAVPAHGPAVAGVSRPLQTTGQLYRQSLDLPTQ